MYHIPGTTPEAKTLDEAFHGRQPEHTVMIGERELQSAYEILNAHTSDAVDMVSPWLSPLQHRRFDAAGPKAGREAVPCSYVDHDASLAV